MSERPPIPQEPDLLPSRRLVLVAVATIVVFGASVLAARGLLVQRRHALGDTPVTAPVRVGLEISNVDQTLLLGARAKPPRPLDDGLRDWRWVDRAAGVVQLPLDVAARVIAEEGPRHRVPEEAVPRGERLPDAAAAVGHHGATSPWPEAPSPVQPAAAPDATPPVQPAAAPDATTQEARP